MLAIATQDTSSHSCSTEATSAGDGTVGVLAAALMWLLGLLRSDVMDTAPVVTGVPCTVVQYAWHRRTVRPCMRHYCVSVAVLHHACIPWRSFRMGVLRK